MKKLLSLLLAGVMAFGLMACGNTKDPETDVMPDNMASMAAPIDALARCMLENNLEYDPQDPEFFWIARSIGPSTSTTWICNSTARSARCSLNRGFTMV